MGGVLVRWMRSCLLGGVEILVKLLLRAFDGWRGRGGYTQAFLILRVGLFVSPA